MNSCKVDHFDPCMHAHCSTMATSMLAMATAMEAAVPRAASVSADWQMPGLDILQAESKAGSVRLTADTMETLVRFLNRLMGKRTD